jgi:hypothetical protein
MGRYSNARLIFGGFSCAAWKYLVPVTRHVVTAAGIIDHCGRQAEACSDRYEARRYLFMLAFSVLFYIPGCALHGDPERNITYPRRF